MDDISILPWHQQPCHALPLIPRPSPPPLKGEGRASVTAVFLSFSLERKGPKVQGRHHRTPHTKRTLPRHVGRGPRARPGRSLAFPHTTQGKKAALMDNALSPCRHRGPRPAISYALGIHPCRRFALSRGTKRSIYDRFMYDLFPPKKRHLSISPQQSPQSNPNHDSYCRHESHGK